MDLVRNHEGVVGIVTDATHEIVLSEPGLKVTIDGDLFNGEKYAESIVTDLLAAIDFEWEPVSH